MTTVPQNLSTRLNAVFHYIISVHSVSERRKGMHEYTCLCCFSLKNLAASVRHPKPPVPIIPFDIVAYTYMLLRDNLSQNSCIGIVRS